MSDFKNKYTGEILPFRCPYNVRPDKGVENVHDDECVVSDYIPIKDQIKLFTASDILKIQALDGIEKELSDLDDDDLEDYVSDDELDTLTDLEVLGPELFSKQELEPQATEKATTTEMSEPRQTNDTSAASGGSALSVNE